MRLTFQLLFLMMGGPLLICQCDKRDSEAYVTIPDAAFLNALIENGVDRDGDGQISVREAETTISLEIGPSGISDLRGIESFIHLDSLMLSMNSLHTIDLSNNSSLRFLQCIGCELKSLDISKNLNLQHLDCSGGAVMSNALTTLDISENRALLSLYCSENKITDLDVSNNVELEELICGRNQISGLDVTSNTGLGRLIVNNNYLTSLDVSRNTSLTRLITCGNQLTSLDISNNLALQTIGVDNMSTIHEVCVWTLPFPPKGVEVLMDFSPNVYFSARCSP